MNTQLEAFVRYHLIYKFKLFCTHDGCSINLYFHVDFCERDTCTILSASLGLAQTCPNNYILKVGWNIFRYLATGVIANVFVLCIYYKLFITGAKYNKNIHSHIYSNSIILTCLISEPTDTLLTFFVSWYLLTSWWSWLFSFFSCWMITSAFLLFTSSSSWFIVTFIP